MRQTISGLIVGIAVMTAAPAFACGGVYGGCSPCGYYACGGFYERLPDPEVQYHSAPTAFPQYYYVNQGPTYTGPGDFAPPRFYSEGGVHGSGGYHRRPHYSYHHRQHVLHSYY
jgi:hypothetical protein